MNTRMAPFDNIEVRRAVAAAIDREQYRKVGPARERALTQLLPPTVFGYDPAFEGQGYDYQAALEHMRKAGYPYDPATDTGGWPDTIEYVVSEVGLLTYTAQVLQQQLARIGLRIRIKLVSYTTHLALVTMPGRVAMTAFNWEPDYPDASSYFEPLFVTSAIGSQYNTAFYSNPHLDDIVDRAHHALDPAARKALYREASEILCDEAPWAFTSGYHFTDVRQPYVHGYRAHPVWTMDLAGVWLDRAADAAARVLGGGLR
jgi:peptide/nickel transport system substrate-binding protein